MKLLLLTGQSGAGLTTALGALEDLRWHCVRSLPISLLPTLAELWEREGITQAAVSLMVHTGQDAQEIRTQAELLRQTGCDCRLVYLEADRQVLINRYKFTRRPHPLADSGVTTAQAIEREHALLTRLRGGVDYKVDTSRLDSRQLREAMIRIATGTQEHILSVSVVSFGFKYGIPADADLVLDVRFLPNPYYLPELRAKNGTDEQVRDYVFRDGTAEEYMEKLGGLVDFLIPQYQREGKAVLTIAVGCTGGRHRSVAIAQALQEHLHHSGILAAAVHRDWQKG